MTRKKDYKHEHPEAGAETGVDQAAELQAEDTTRLREELEHARQREDELLRAVAELTNVNRRRKQDMETLVQFGQEALVKDLLPVVDDIDRALASSSDREGDPFRSGLLLIRERLWKTLEREGLEAIEAQGVPFDPELMDAVSQAPSQDRPAGTVIEVLVPGYRFKGRVLRHAQVVVAASSERAHGDETGKGNES